LERRLARLVILFAVALFAAPAMAAAAPKDPLSLVPADAAGVGILNLRQLSKAGAITAAVDFLNTLSGPEALASQMLRDARIDPDRDLEKAAIIIGKGEDDDEEYGPLPKALVVSGRFDAQAIYDIARKRSGGRLKETNVGGIDMLQSPTSLSGVIDNSILLTGTTKLVEKIIAVHGGSAKPLPADSPLMRLGKDHRNSSFWMVADVYAAPGSKRQLATMASTGLDSSKLQHLVAWADVTSGSTSFRTEVRCADPETAQLMKTWLQLVTNMTVGMGRIITAERPRDQQTVNRVARRLTTGADGSTAYIESELSAKLLARLRSAVLGLGTGEERVNSMQPRIFR